MDTLRAIMKIDYALKNILGAYVTNCCINSSINTIDITYLIRAHEVTLSVTCGTDTTYRLSTEGGEYCVRTLELHDLDMVTLVLADLADLFLDEFDVHEGEENNG